MQPPITTNTSKALRTRLILCVACWLILRLSHVCNLRGTCFITHATWVRWNTQACVHMCVNPSQQLHQQLSNKSKDFRTLINATSISSQQPAAAAARTLALALTAPPPTATKRNASNSFVAHAHPVRRSLAIWYLAVFLEKYAN